MPLWRLPKLLLVRVLPPERWVLFGLRLSVRPGSCPLGLE
jgi:hypothetical protein